MARLDGREGGRGRRLRAAAVVALAVLGAMGPGAGSAQAAEEHKTSTTVNCGAGALTVGVTRTCAVVVEDSAGTGKTTPKGKVAMTQPASGFSPSTCELVAVPEKTGLSECSVEFTPSAAGSPKVTAAYEGDGTHSASEGFDPVTVKTRATVLKLVCVPEALVAGQVTTCKVTVSDNTHEGTPSAPAGTVEFESSGAESFAGGCKLAPVDAASASCEVAYEPKKQGAHELTAEYAGDETTHGRSEETKTLSVSPRASALSVSCGSEAVLVGQPVKCTVTLADGGSPGKPIAPTGEVHLKVPPAQGTLSPERCKPEAPAPGVEPLTCPVEYVPAEAGGGTNKIVAGYAGDETHTATEVEAVLQVRRATTVTVSCPAAAGTGQTVTCQATVADATPTGEATAPTQPLTLSTGAAGSFTPQTTCQPSASAGHAQSVCLFQYTSSQAGANTITVTYGGDATHIAATGTATIAVSAPVVTTVPTPTPTPKAAQAPPPSCRIVGKEIWRGVHRHGHRKFVPSLVVTYTCDQVAAVRVESRIAVPAFRRGNRRIKAKAYALELATAQAPAGAQGPVIQQALPDQVANALRAKVHAPLTISFAVANANGSGKAMLKFTLLPRGSK